MSGERSEKMNERMTDIFNWYEPYQNENDLTVAEVYSRMPGRVKEAIKRTMNYAVHRKSSRLDDAKIINSLPKIEKEVAYFLIGEAATYGDNIFDMVECWLLLHQYGGLDES